MRTFGEAPPPPSFFEKLKAGLTKSADALGIGDTILRKKLDAETVAELEEKLIRADLGARAAADISAAIAKGRYDTEIAPYDLKILLSKEIQGLLQPSQAAFEIDSQTKPYVVLITGVNGAGKTTTIGKIAAMLTQEGKKVVLAAGDTFRAAAIEQLQVWGERAHAQVVARQAGADAAGLAFDAVKQARETGADIVLIDTAGRMQNKAGLMAELEKIIRVIKKIDASAPHASLLVLDATTGQNAISQVEAFKQTANVTGLVMTKLDGSAKGGILVALASRFNLPIHFVGVGEGVEDLQPFHAESFAKLLTGAA